MRRFPLTAAVLVALACAACSKETAKAPPATAAPAPAEAASAAPVVETPTPAPAAAAEPALAAEAAPPSLPVAKTPPPERVVRVVPGRERRIHALINNAISRDVTGDTEHAAAMWETRRAACKTQACVDRAYAAQETELRKWEGSEAIR